MKGKPTKIDFNREYTPPGKSTIYYFDIVWENGDKGQFSSAKKDQTKFQVGVEVEYVVEVKTSPRGEYNFYNIVKDQTPFGKRKWDPEASKRIRKTNLLRNSGIFAAGMNEPVDEYLRKLNELELEHCGELVEDNDQKRTTFQGALNSIAEVTKVKLQCDANFKYTPEDICKQVVQFYNYVSK